MYDPQVVPFKIVSGDRDVHRRLPSSADIVVTYDRALGVQSLT